MPRKPSPCAFLTCTLLLPSLPLSLVSFVLKAAEAASSEDWDTALSTNVKGYGLCIKHAVRAMRASPGGAPQGDASGSRPGACLCSDCWGPGVVGRGRRRHHHLAAAHLTITATHRTGKQKKQAALPL